MLQLSDNRAKSIPTQLFYTTFIFIIQLNQKVTSIEISDYKYQFMPQYISKYELNYINSMKKLT